ncbi:hypothetical protein BFP70_14975 [Thioclava sp. SK-1]|uniref:COG4223 family protein n=1 Tax=Thioclava sp. SK-1 TaxID=1889770 RepID=UPI0008250D05|nr:hypothetical protein [Thioclava sp. SK-1]OCX61610.1 hypothetical protein BFP70_14975 [Thioclava sp. SK-1]
MPEPEEKTSDQTEAMADQTPNRTTESEASTDDDAVTLDTQAHVGEDDIVAASRPNEGDTDTAAQDTPVSDAPDSVTGDAAPILVPKSDEESEPTDIADAPADKSEDKDAASPVAPAADSSGSGFLPLLLGGVIAAVIGAGAMVFVLPKLPPALSAKFMPETDAGQIDGSLSDLAARLDALTQELESVKASPLAAPDLSGVQNGIDEAISSASDLGNALTGLDDRLSALEARNDTSGGSADFSAMQAEIASLKAMVEDGGGAEIQQRIAQAAQEAQDKITAAEEQAAKLRADSQSAANAALAQAAIARLAAALDSGAPTDKAIADLQAADYNVPDALTADVPSIEALQSSFAAPARAALDASRKQAAQNASAGDKLKTFFLTQTGARSLNEQEGDTPNAVLSRAQTAVDHADFDTAVADVSGLPEAGQAAMADWVAQAQKRIDALSALDQLGTDAN